MYPTFIHSSLDGYVVCSHVLAMVKSAAKEHGGAYIFRIIVLSDIFPGMGLLGHVIALFIVFEEPL